MAAYRRHTRIRKRVGLSALALLGVVVLLAGISLIGAATTPGNQSFQAKWADWLRAHHAAVLANALEQYYYNHNAPPKGGRPKTLNSLPPGPKAPEGLASVTHLPPPVPVPLVVSPALPQEGQWQAVGPTVRGIPAMYEAQFRADAVYTSQITSAVWIDPTLLRVSLIPGAQEPGGTWAHPPYIDSTELPGAVAAFNGGFRMSDAHGGFYLNGRTAVPLQQGAASVVIYSSGKIDIGTWGNEVSMTPKVVAVLQNLVPIVDGGKTAPDATYSDSRIWGFTLGAKTVVARSGIGVTADGALVYVAGPALTARSLAESLKRAGAVRAMALDINPEWVTFNFYEHESGGAVSGVKLYPQMQRSADRYLPPVSESRDFFLVSLPPNGSTN
jgi:hypothetical protein